jgi:dienelactone hydrolase
MAARFLAEFLTDGERGWLSATSRAPSVEAVALEAGGPASLWRPAGKPPWRGLVLVHGLTPDGKDDPRLTWAARLLARTGLAVIVPDLPRLRSQQLSLDDAAPVAAAVRRLTTDPRVGAPFAVVSVSVATGPVFAALAEPGSGAGVDLVVTLGGYADARELVRYFTTGAYAYREVAGRSRIDPGPVQAFLARNLDLVRDPAARALVANTDPARVDALLAALPGEAQSLLDGLSPARYAPRIGARLLLVHGRADPTVPFTESMRLAATRDAGRRRLVLVGVVEHVEGRAPARPPATDLLRLWSVLYEILSG